MRTSGNTRSCSKAIEASTTPATAIYQPPLRALTLKLLSCSIGTAAASSRALANGTTSRQDGSSVNRRRMIFIVRGHMLTARSHFVRCLSQSRNCGGRSLLLLGRRTIAELTRTLRQISLDYTLLGPQSAHNVVDDVCATVAYLKNELQKSLPADSPSLDTDRVAVAGSSAGGYVAYVAAAVLPGAFKALVSIYGAGGDLLTDWYLQEKTGSSSRNLHSVLLTA